MSGTVGERGERGEGNALERGGASEGQVHLSTDTGVHLFTSLPLFCGIPPGDQALTIKVNPDANDGSPFSMSAGSVATHVIRLAAAHDTMVKRRVICCIL
jgi:hypothetical protein